MTEAERALLVKMAGAWNDFLALGDHHPSDIEEFRVSLHRLQEKVMARVARREHPEFFN